MGYFAHRLDALDCELSRGQDVVQDVNLWDSAICLLSVEREAFQLNMDCGGNACTSDLAVNNNDL